MADHDLEELKKNPGTLRLYTSRLKLGRRGQELWGLCPFHAEKTPSFAVKLKDGAYVYFCQGCKEGGDVISFVEKFDRLTTRAAIEKVREALGKSWDAQKQEVEKTFREVAPARKDFKTFPLSACLKFETALQTNPTALAWLLKERGITAEAARKCHLGFRQDVGMLAGQQNQDIAAAGWIVFPCIAGETVVSIKYRSIARKAFCRQGGMATALFNTETVDTFEPLYVTEGEFDAVVLEQAGFRAVSLPSAISELTPAMKDQIMQADRILLAGDCDNGVGSKAMESLWAQLQERTFLLKWPLGRKDANETFLQHCAGDVAKFRALVEELTTQAYSVPMPNVYSLQEAMVSANRTNLADHPQRLRFPWAAVDRMAILLPGSVLTLFATNTKQGKTAFVMNATLHGARKHQEVVLNYQCELNPDEFSNIVAAHVLRRSRNNLAPDDYRAAAALLGPEVKYYIGNNQTLTTVTPVLDLIEAAVRRLGATVVVLDHIHFICRNESDEVQAQANAMQRIKKMAQRYRLKVIVVGQPRKANQQNKGKVVHLTDLKGSEAVASDADAIIAIHRGYVKVKDSANPPMDDYDPKTEVHLLGARAKGDGATYSELMFVGDLATFHDIAYDSPPLPPGQQNLS